ncbi:flagellar filament capping protein FliD [Massilia sp. DWR3-1-1]|uniref:flagellar filament capping protein FliD n=1 Tax=Massilia sp. DWR3-1-1 TaxID=2804559 RepID=UPI003CF9278C
MATISSSGVGSGLPVESLVSQLMAVERMPINAIDKKQAVLTEKLTAFGTMKSALATLQTAARALATPALIAPIKTTVADPTVLSATATGGTATGNYAIEVQSLAQQQKLKTSVSYGATTDVVGTGTITFDFSSYTAVAGSDPAEFSFDTANVHGATTITIDEDHKTLAGVRDAINAANAGVTASIINNGEGNFLSFASTSTGAKNAMRIVADPALAAFAYDGSASSEMTQSVSAKDAVIFVDNVKITKASNTITDAIDGVTLTLTKPTASGVTTTLSLARDTSTVKTNIEAFVKAYNDASKSMVDLTAYDTTTGKGAVLNGDGTVRTIQTQLRALMGSAIPGAAAGGATLPDIGITTQRDGTISIDSTKLDKALADPTKNFTSLFATNDGNRGFGAQMDVTLGRILSPVGTLPSHTNSFNSSIKDLEKQRTTLTARLADVEKRYRAQFSALDSAMASMTTTSTYLTQQLAAIAA